MSRAGSVSFETVTRAALLLADYLPESPLRRERGGRAILKDEASLPTGSFKVRGALNRILSDRTGACTQGVVAASAGNHGMGVAYAARRVGAKATIVVPRAAVAVKVAGIRELGAEVVQAGGGYAVAERLGRRLAAERGAVWVSPYNDVQVIAGQGVAGLELLRQLEASGEGALDEVYVPVGGGGLVAGIGVVLRRLSPGTRVVGAQPAASPFMAVAFGGEDRRRVIERATAADGLAGDVEQGAVTIGLVRRVVDAMVLVSEAQIREAAAWAWEEAELRVEPSAAVAVAAYLAHGAGRCGVIVSGGNADPEWLAGCGVPPASG
jgi:threonine dehydratase